MGVLLTLIFLPVIILFKMMKLILKIIVGVVLFGLILLIG